MRTIQERRKALGLTQIDLAIKAGCSPPFISNCERGYMPKGSPTVKRVIEALDKAEAAR